MRQFKTTMAAACVTLAMTAGLATAQTTPPDRRTFVTFSAPVSLPGMTLPAGTYTFRIMDSNTDRHIVQVFNQDGTKLMTTLMAVPAERREPTGDPVITFKETAANHAPAVRYWYYAGDLAGNEFVYPKNQAQMIANASGEPVMAVDSEGSSIDDWKKGDVSKVMPNTTADAQSSTNGQSASTSTTTASNTAQPSTAPATAESQTAQTTTAQSSATQPTTSAADTRPATAPTTMDQSAQSNAQTPSTAPSTASNTAVGTSGRSERLPKTGSQLPMVGLIGLLALGGAVAVRAARTA